MPTQVAALERRLLFALALLAGVIGCAALGYYLIGDHWSPLDAPYMAVITVTTVGFTEVHPLTPFERGYTILVILGGVGAFTFAATSVANYLIAGQLGGMLERHRMENTIAGMQQHYIVCGFGRMGEQVAREFRRAGRDIVVIDSAEDALERAHGAGFPIVRGDAGDDEILRHAGIERAAGLVAVVEDDAANLLVTLSARGLNPRLLIVARANQQSSEPKLLKAGANRVLWPYGVGGRRLAQMALRPTVVEFLDVVMHDDRMELVLEEAIVVAGAPLEDQKIGSAHVRERTGASIVAVRRSGKLMASPAPQDSLQAGDVLVVLGTQDQIRQLRALCGAPAAHT